MMVIIVLGIRFLLEIITIIGLFSGIFIGKSISSKTLFLVLSVGIALLWARYGAPKSSNVLIGINKLLLEVFVYTVGFVGFYKLFGQNIGIIYIIVVVLDLTLMYVLGLQRN